MNELERIEAQALREAVVLGGGRAETAGGAVCVRHPGTSLPELNRGLPVGAVVDAAAVHRWFEGGAHVVCAPPGYLGLEESLEALGYTRGYAWMKFERNDAPAPAVETDLRVEETLDAEAFAVASAGGYGFTAELARSLSAFVGAPGWRAFVAFAGDEPAACGALYADGDHGWLGVATTLPEYRRRGAQSALLAARIEAGRANGVRRFAAETGKRVEGRPDQSYRNILRAGFREAYLRPNWHSPS
ncbi:MAG TPA: GNAT family N-acetyltransferase [Gaiellaceae bacterium]|nr:GNAT family N-acetyltransferase [Gaiellaceae bacterium]